MNQAIRPWRGDVDWTDEDPSPWPPQTFWYMMTGQWQALVGSHITGDQSPPSVWFEVEHCLGMSRRP